MGNLSFQCRKCSHDYDLQGRKPHVLPGCDHSICSGCLDKMLDGARNSVNCAICGKLYEFPKEHAVCKADFPEDLATITEGLMRKPQDLRQMTCKSHGQPVTHLCLDSGSCQEKDPCCLKCLKADHAGCSPELIVLIEKFDKEIIIEKQGLNVEEWAATLKTAISAKMRELEARLKVFVDAAASLICYQYRSLSYVCPSNVKYLRDILRTQFDPATKKVSLGHRKKDLILQFAQDVKLSMTSDFWKALRTKENDQLTFASRKHFLLKRNATKADEVIVSRLENPNMQVKERYILPFLEFDSHMTIEEYGAKLRNLCHMVPRQNDRLPMVNFSKMKPELQSLAVDVLARVTADKSIPSFKVGHSVEEELRRQAPLAGKAWRCVHNPTCFSYESRFGEFYLDVTIEKTRFVVFMEG